ncbi:MAG TPA: signal peptide peptidase SppA [Candidatus Avacidaminococcus intestinavium]|uniref:Signal peptide peptidase SppA n=1 Tax=Candidatus Avacidaminococcus intestinavium TaxID=2840684 RepID=A0A9D1MPJ9_9FIRM|nr:signal peptide peptidase SppA [Candidatus Avacidaminococcus intestinavium]
MLKRIFMSVILLIAILSFVVSLLDGKNNENVALQTSERIAVIRVEGEITSGDATTSLFDENAATTDSIMAQFREAAEDNTVKAVLLRINSPGGSVTAAEEIGREIERYKATTGRPVVVSMGDTAASAGYWLAAYSDKIYANASTLTGSIGVYIPYMNTEELYKKIGIQSKKIKSGEFKDILSNERPMTPAEQELLQKMVNEMYEQFVDVVSQGRNLTPEQVRSLADGRVYTGKQAKEVGLVDELGNFYDALDATGALVGISGTPEVKDFRKAKPWESLFSSKATNFLVESVAERILQQGSNGWQTPRAER